MISSKNSKILEDFIHHIYNPEKKYFYMPIENHDLDFVKKLLESVLKKLNEKREDKEIVISNINVICEGLEYCPDRKVAELLNYIEHTIF